MRKELVRSVNASTFPYFWRMQEMLFQGVDALANAKTWEGIPRFVLLAFFWKEEFFNLQTELERLLSLGLRDDEWEALWNEGPSNYFFEGGGGRIFCEMFLDQVRQLRASDGGRVRPVR